MRHFRLMLLALVILTTCALVAQAQDSELKDGPTSVKIDKPEGGTVYAGPTDMDLEAKAEDPDGTISRVEFYGNGDLIGTGARRDEKTFVIKKRNLSYGIHVFKAVAVDNQGRENSALAGGIFVNGLATIDIKSPRMGDSFVSGADLKLVAAVKHPSANVIKVEFVDQTGRVIGEGSIALGTNTLSFGRMLKKGCT